MALTWGDLNGKVHDKIIPTVADVVNVGDPVRQRAAEKLSLIDSNPEMGTMAQAGYAGQRERLSERGSHEDRATVRSASNTEDAESGRNDRSSRITGSNNTRYKSSPVFIRIRTQNGQQFDGGVNIRQNIGYAELNGAPFGRGQSFNTDYVPTDTSFSVAPKFGSEDPGLATLKGVVRQFSLIDSNAEMPTRRKAKSRRERLSERTSFGMMQQSELVGICNHESPAEMTGLQPIAA